MIPTRRDWVLLLLALRDAVEPLDPVRVHSGMFMLSGHLAPEYRYEFELVESGPFSAALEADVEELEDEGLIAHHGVANYTWSEYTATDAGLARATEVIEGMDARERAALRELASLKQRVLRLGFSELMSYLSKNYPAPDSRSVRR